VFLRSRNEPPTQFLGAASDGADMVNKKIASIQPAATEVSGIHPPTAEPQDSPQPFSIPREWSETPILEPRDLADLRNLFVQPPKFIIGTTVPERIYLALLDSRAGISNYMEEAINAFDGDMKSLVEAAGRISEERKAARQDTGIRSISGRVPKAAFNRLEEIDKALEGIRGMSRAKVLAGLVQLKLNSMK